jgi:hypothetical protein
MWAQACTGLFASVRDNRSQHLLMVAERDWLIAALLQWVLAGKCKKGRRSKNGQKNWPTMTRRKGFRQVREKNPEQKKRNVIRKFIGRSVFRGHARRDEDHYAAAF